MQELLEHDGSPWISFLFCRGGSSLSCFFVVSTSNFIESTAVRDFHWHVAVKLLTDHWQSNEHHWTCDADYRIFLVETVMRSQFPVTNVILDHDDLNLMNPWYICIYFFTTGGTYHRYVHVSGISSASKLPLRWTMSILKLFRCPPRISRCSRVKNACVKMTKRPAEFLVECHQVTTGAPGPWQTGI